MNEAQARQKVVSVMNGWVGRNMKDGSHKIIIDIYNDHKPLARNYAVKYDDAYCATGASAAAIVAEFTDIIPTECSCEKQIELWKKLGRWEEKDAHVPEPGDYLYYDWSDKKNYATTENTGHADHVGVVEKVIGTTITVTECNMGDGFVGKRNLQVNGRYIRGYGLPDYASKADEKDVVNVTGNLQIGDIVNFTGTKQYTSSYTGAKSTACRGGKARITAISKGKAHPYHLVAIIGSASKVYGWVDAKDINGACGCTDVTIKVGDTVQYSGDVHYTSSYIGAKKKTCKGGTAKVTAIKKGNPYPYHLVHAGKGCTVYGWVEADKVSK